MNRATQHLLRIVRENLGYLFNKRYKLIPLFDENTFKVITLNLRRDVLEDGENGWLHRRGNIINFLKDEKPHVFCAQEVMPHMYKHLLIELGRVYNGYGVDNLSGCTLDKSLLWNSEGNAILYDKTKYRLLDKGVFWLSSKPNKPSATWENKIRRTCIYVWLEDVNSGNKFYVFNTHFDHKSTKARNESAHLVREMIHDITQGQEVYLTGDFNMPIGEIYSLNGVLNNTYNLDKSCTFNALKKERKKTLDAIYFNFSKEFKVSIPDVKLSDHSPVIIYE